MKRLSFLLALASLSSPGMAHAAKQPVAWQSAKLLSFGAQQQDYTYSYPTSQTNTDGVTSTQTNLGNSSYVDYQVVLDDGKMLYFGVWRLVFRWQHDPKFTENETVRFDLDGNKLTVIDDSGKEIKMKLLKRRIKE